ncbi:MAG: hypothetical protein FWG12_06735 [Holophagaceae bacterium]|nr:hypothetical protein [Holophagaceae bacterium]
MGAARFMAIFRCGRCGLSNSLPQLHDVLTRTVSLCLPVAAAILFLFAPTSLFAQGYINVEQRIRIATQEKWAIVFVCNGESKEEANVATAQIRSALLKTTETISIGINELGAEQYEKLCEIFSANLITDKLVIFIYYNEKFIQFPYDPQTADIVQRLKDLGWVPGSQMQQAKQFLVDHPNNQEALAELLRLQLFDFYKDLLDGSQLVKTLELLSDADVMYWRHQFSVSVFAHMVVNFRVFLNPSHYDALKETPGFQKALSKLIIRTEAEIRRYPNDARLYDFWAFFVSMDQSPRNPMEFMSSIRFPPQGPNFMADFSVLAVPFFMIDKTDEGLKVLDDIEEWLVNQDAYGSYFYWQRKSLALFKLFNLIKSEKFIETESYLRDLMYELGPKWSEFSKEIKFELPLKLKYFKIEIQDPAITAKINALLDEPPSQQIKPYHKPLLLTHNISKKCYDLLIADIEGKKVQLHATRTLLMPLNAWTLQKDGVEVASGSVPTVPDDSDSDALSAISPLLDAVVKEDRKYLNSLRSIVRSNPDNFYAIALFRDAAVKYLPDEALESELLAYTVIDKLPIGLSAYSKLVNKAPWVRLRSAVIREMLGNLGDSPFQSELSNPWRVLSQWEDLEISDNEIDWYSILHATEFWRNHLYYTQTRIMPEDVFIKYLRQAEKRGDWLAILNACEARFNGDKTKPNDWVLKIWDQVEGMGLR